MTSLRRELERKALHVTSAAAPLAYAAGVPRRMLLVTLGALLAVAVLVEVVRQRHRLVREQFARVVGRLLRAHEHARWAGATWMLLSFTLAVALLPRAVAIAAMWGVSVGDAAAAVVGRWWSGRPTRQAPDAVRTNVHTSVHASVQTSGKTIAGSLACALGSLAGALVIARLSVVEALLAAVLAAAAERPRWTLDDNLRIVVAVGSGIMLWRMLFS